MASEIKEVHGEVDKIVKALQDGGTAIVRMKNSVRAGKGEAGHSDYALIVGGIHIAIECKYDMYLSYPGKMSTARDKRPTSLQAKRLAAVDHAGGVALVVDRNTVGLLPVFLRDLSIWACTGSLYDMQTEAEHFAGTLWYTHNILPIRGVEF